MRSLAIFLSTFFIISCSSEPKNFDDCVLEYVSKAPTVIAANAAYDACLNKFPKK